MTSIRTGTILAVLAVVVTGISMANKPNEGNDYSITVSPNTLMLSRDIVCVTIHSNIPYEAVEVVALEIDGAEFSDYSTKPDSLGHLVVKLDGNAVKEVLEQNFDGPCLVEFTLDVQIEGKDVSASDKIRVKE